MRPPPKHTVEDAETRFKIKVMDRSGLGMLGLHYKVLREHELLEGTLIQDYIPEDANNPETVGLWRKP